MTQHYFPGPMPQLQVLWGYGYCDEFRVAEDQLVFVALSLRASSARGPRPARGLVDVPLHPDFELHTLFHAPSAPPSPFYPTGKEGRTVMLHLSPVPSLPRDYIRVICLKVLKQFNAPPDNPTFWCSTCPHELECMMST